MSLSTIATPTGPFNPMSFQIECEFSLWNIFIPSFIIPFEPWINPLSNPPLQPTSQDVGGEDNVFETFLNFYILVKDSIFLI